jgi:hypothetical protein
MGNILNNRMERIKIFLDKGYTGDILTGKVYNKNGKLIETKTKAGYYSINTTMNKKGISVLQHQFIYYLSTGKVVKNIDHKNRNGFDNRIDNLREATNSENQWNRGDYKGYYWYKITKKWKASIRYNGNKLHLGYFVKEEDARRCYLAAREKYQIIK